MKKLIYLLLSLILLSCNKTDENNSEAYMFLQDNGIDTKGLTILSNCFKDLSPIGSYSYVDNYYYYSAGLISGIKNNKFNIYILKGLDDYQKNKSAMTLISHIIRNTVRTKGDTRIFDYGYGNHVQMSWEYYNVAKILVAEDVTYAIINDTYSNSDNTKSNNIFSLLIQNGTSQHEIELSDDFGSSNSNIMLGFNNSIICNYIENNVSKMDCYSKDGDLISQYSQANFFNTSVFFTEKNELYYPLSETDFVVISIDSEEASARFINIRTNKTTSNVIKLKNANDNDRIDSFSLVKENGIFLYYQINETKYSGEKITRTLVIDTENKTVSES